MTKLTEIKVPDIGSAGDVAVIEVAVKAGDQIKAEQTLITLESDKASMDVPSPQAGIIKDVIVKVGDKVSQGSLILTLVSQDMAADSSAKAVNNSPANASPVETKREVKQITIPDIGTTTAAAVIEVSIKPGDVVKKDATLLTLEGEKATMEVPSPYTGVIKTVTVKVGDKVNTGTAVAQIEADMTDVKTVTPAPASVAASPQRPATAPTAAKPAPVVSSGPVVDLSQVHASPGVRRFARELGVDLTHVSGTGPKSRILKDDVKAYVKTVMSKGAATGSALPAAPQVDFTQFGAIEAKPLTRIKKLTATNLHRNWLLVPHVTQFIDADITDMEEFRKSSQAEAKEKGVKLTPLVFIMKAVVTALKEYPQFNASLDANGEQLILKKYFNIGVAVDTPEGLVVPVIRDVDRKGFMDLAQELAVVSEKARQKLLTPRDMQGGCFTISSLGGIGGTAFTPIVNLPEVAILGVSKATMQLVHHDGEFVPRLILPLSLSYDHRVIDGAEGARFMVFLSKCLTDLKLLLL